MMFPKDEPSSFKIFGSRVNWNLDVEHENQDLPFENGAFLTLEGRQN